MHDVVREPLPSQVPSRLGGRTASKDDPLCAFRLAGERRDRRLRDVGFHSSERELVTDAFVPGAALGESVRPRLGVPVVVDEGGTNESLEDIVALALADAATLEEAVDLERRAVAVAERTERELQRRLDGCRGVSSRRGPPRPPRRPTPPRSQPRRRPARAGDAPR